ncbi:MAG: thermonuclease family protein [Alphaproteobacteria bacterium]|nr:thermonuclease family protein [Alphaproteobacteria bacterium]
MAFALAGGIFAAVSMLGGVGPKAAGPMVPARPAIEAISGAARVVDGDTIDVAGQRVRLEGIDAPESAQTCPGRYARGMLGPWRCGVAASLGLAKLIGSQAVACESHETDKYGRLVATCFVDGRDINREMVRLGHAWAFVKYSTTYVAEEAAARSAKAGIWASIERAQPAWEYRSRRWENAEQTTPQGCVIKGNISARGERIYHTPWSPWYAKVRVNVRDGEQWFCDERQAMEAGFRPAMGR